VFKLLNDIIQNPQSPSEEMVILRMVTESMTRAE